MLSNKIVVIAKSAPPSVCGMSDYSYNVALSLNKFYKVVEVGVAELPQASNEAKQNELTVKPWRETLLQNNRDNNAYHILLNYTPTSYSKLGYPAHLIRELKKFKSQNSDNRLFVHFHESWSGNPNLKLHHAIRDKLIKKAMYKIASMADGIAVFTKEQKEKLKTSFGFSDIHFNLIGSSILPEFKDQGLTSKRQNGEWIVFGLPHNRLWAIEANLQLLKIIFSNGKLKHLITIGPIDNNFSQKEVSLCEEHFGKGVLVQLGALDAQQVSLQFLKAQGAVLGQNYDSLHKSSSFAALAAHAVPVVCNVPITLSDPPATAIFRSDEIINNVDIISNPEGESKSRQLHSWFWTTRSWDVIGEDIYKWMKHGDYKQSSQNQKNV